MARYRATQRIHLPPPEEGSIDQGDIIEWDGKILTLASGEERKLMHPAGLTAAIRVKWLVPEEDTESTYVPQPGGVEVHAAQSTGDQRARVNVMTVQNEERNLGTTASVRQAGDVNRGAAPTGALVERDSDDGRVVGRFKNSAKADPIEIGKNDLQTRSKLDNATKVEVERLGVPVRSATGDVQETRVGEDLSELLPDAVSSGRPAATFNNDGVQVTSGGSPVGGQEEGVVIGKIGSAPAEKAQPLDKNAQALEGALRKWATTGETWDGKPVHLGELAVMAKSVLRDLDATRRKLAAAQSAPVDLPEPPEEEEPEPLPPVEGGIEWDTTLHWKKREMIALNDYGQDPDALRQILELEPSAGVKKAISARLDELGS
jgi:hypothetical protein